MSQMQPAKQPFTVVIQESMKYCASTRANLTKSFCVDTTDTGMFTHCTAVGAMHFFILTEGYKELDYLQINILTSTGERLSKKLFENSKFLIKTINKTRCMFVPDTVERPATPSQSSVVA